MNLENIPDPPDLPGGDHEGWGHLHINQTWLAMVWPALEWTGFQSQA